MKPNSRLLIIGCGDIGLRVARLLRGRVQLLALTSSLERMPILRASGITPVLGNLDHPHTLSRLAGLASWVLHLAPPPAQGQTDPRTAHLLQALSRRGKVTRLVYASTTGVYGDAQGDLVAETRVVNPQTDRAKRRVDAEQWVRAWGRSLGVQISILRVPGIYAVDREGGHPKDRVLKRLPVLHHDEDVYTNHIHADDLARACVAALMRGGPQRLFNICDETQLKMGDYYDEVADLYDLPRPPRLSRAEMQAAVSPMSWSFMNESRRIQADRMRNELRLKLNNPSFLNGFNCSIS
jgi:nucleoside-diphosphate-sugar epimerase